MEHFYFDLDGGICADDLDDPECAVPKWDGIQLCNEMHKLGYRVELFTMRPDDRYHRELTARQLHEWFVLYSAIHYQKSAVDEWVKHAEWDGLV